MKTFYYLLEGAVVACMTRNTMNPLPVGRKSVRHIPAMASAEGSTHHRTPVLQDDWVYNISAANTSLTPEYLVVTIKVLVNHEASAPMASHCSFLVRFIGFQYLLFLQWHYSTSS
jgi:hypothetical protein